MDNGILTESKVPGHRWWQRLNCTCRDGQMQPAFLLELMWPPTSEARKAVFCLNHAAEAAIDASW